MLGGLAPLAFELFEFLLPGLDALEQCGFLGHHRLGCLRAGGHGQAQAAELGLLARQQGNLFAHLPIQFAPSWIDDLDGVRKRLNPILHQPVNLVVFAHVLKEVFLTPPREQRHRRLILGALIIGGQRRGLMARGFAVPNLPHP